jgi:penicillin-binding protein 2
MDQLFNRKYVIQGLFVLLAILLLGNLFYIQIGTDKYFINANSNALRKSYIFPARGVILDRNNKILAQNQPTYDLIVTPKLVKPFDTLSLCEIIGIDMPTFREKLRKATVKSRYQASIFQKLLSVQTYAALQEKLANYEGFDVQKRTIRYYPDSIASHFLGYMREVTQSDIEKYNGYYKSGDYIGKTGIEKEYEVNLRGTKGVTHILYNAKNVAQGKYADGKLDSMAISGDQLISTIDSRIQKLGEELMANKVGSIVAIEPATGEVLAFVSSPGYDPNKLVGSNFSNNYREIFANPNRAFIVRPIQGGYSPGSAFKPLDALIALSEGVVDANSTIFCPGYYVAGNRRFKCEHTDGNTNLRWALSRSCNTYFYSIFAKMMTKNGGSRIKQQAAYEAWQNKVRKFGIGDTLGIDFPGEKAYKLYRKKDYDKMHGKYWSNSTVMSLAIGQGEISTTPLQMANIMAIIANRGYYLKPHLVKGIGSNKYVDPKYKEKHYVDIDAKHFELVIDGMQDAVNTSTGTATESRLRNIIMAGKTGTVQNSRGKNHSVFIGFAPRDNPKIAIAVIVENGGYGGAYAAPIASYITEKYLTDSLTGRLINGATIQKYKDANLLPIIKSTKSIYKNTDSLKADTVNKNKNNERNKIAINIFNKDIDKPRKNAATK